MPEDPAVTAARQNLANAVATAGALLVSASRGDPSAAPDVLTAATNAVTAAEAALKARLVSRAGDKALSPLRR